MNKLYFGLQANSKLTWRFILIIAALLFFIFSKPSSLHWVSGGFLIGAIPSFIWLGYQQLKNKKPNKEQTVQVSNTTGDAMKN